MASQCLCPCRESCRPIIELLHIEKEIKDLEIDGLADRPRGLEQAQEDDLLTGLHDKRVCIQEASRLILKMDFLHVLESLEINFRVWMKNHGLKLSAQSLSETISDGFDRAVKEFGPENCGNIATCVVAGIKRTVLTALLPGEGSRT